MWSLFVLLITRLTTGKAVYQIPNGSSNHMGLFGYISVFDEMVSQGLLDNFDDLVFACGSGGTAASLIIANYLTGSRLRIHGISVSRTSEEIHRICNDLIKDAGLDVKSEDMFDFIDVHRKPGYALYLQEHLDFCIGASSSTGILLDPVYTGKAVYGMLDELQNNPGRFKGSRIVFLHTGGLFGMYDKGIQTHLKLPGIATNDVTVWTNSE